MTLKQQLEYDARPSGNIKLKILMEPLDTQSLPFSIEVSRNRFRNYDRSVLNETKRILETKTLKKSYPKIGPAKDPK